jgi:hypothetical protein
MHLALDRPASLLTYAYLVAASCGVIACNGDRVDVSTGPAIAGSGQGPAGGGDEGGSSSATAGGAGGEGGAGGAGRGGGSSGGGGSGATEGAGGAGGDPWETCAVIADCIGDQPTICPENACESADLFFDCPDGELPAAYTACITGADTLRDNVWAHLVDCLRDATEAELCDPASTVIATCRASATANVCLNPAATQTCADAAEGCQDPADYGVAQCEADLAPFGEEGLAEYSGCIADVAGTTPCGERHPTCFDSLLGP